jgi:DNA-binding transcriptional ArsR family regulator
LRGAADYGRSRYDVLILENISAVKATAQVRQPAGVECCMALWSGRAPEREPLLKIAQRIQHGMHPAAQASLRVLDDAFAEWPLFAINAFYGLRGDDLDESLDLLRHQSSRSIAVAFLGVTQGAAEEARGGGRDPLEAVLRNKYVSAVTQRRARALIAEPHETVSHVLRVVESFARAGFQEIFERQRERFAVAAAELGRQLADDAPRAIAGLSSRAVLERSRDRVTFLSGSIGQLVACAELERFDVIPSYWLRRRVVLAQAPGRAALCMSIGHPRRNEIDRENTMIMLSTLGEPRRFAIFMMCLERSRTTRELAAALGITEGPVSRHLKTLERDGLVVRQRSGRTVMYTAVVEVLELLGHALLGLPRQTLSPGG